MKKVKKSLGRLAPKILNFIIVMLMLFQPVGTPGMIAIAQETGVANVEAPANDPVPEAEEPEAEAPAEEAPAQDPAPAADPSQDLTPAVDTSVAEEATPVDTTPTEEAPAVTEPETPVVETPAAEEVPAVSEQDDIWSKDGDIETTNDSVELEKTYVAPQNDQVSVKFTKLPDNPGTLSIEEITLTDEQVTSFNALSNKAYDITSSMENGTFEFDLTLPKTDDNAVGISYIEKSADELDTATDEEVKMIDEDKVDVKDDTVETTAIDHFTIFFTTTLNGTTITVTPHEYLQGQTVYVKADGLSGYSNYYQLYIKPVSSAEFPIGSCDNGPIIGSNSRTTSYVLPANAETGEWTVELYRFSNSSCTSNKTSQQTPWPTFTVNENNAESTLGNNAGTGADVSGVGSATWSNSGNITADDNSYATASGNNQTHYLQGTNYGFNIPVGATINGITVNIGRKGTNGSGDDVRDMVVKLVKNGAVTGNNKAATSTDWPSNEALALYGSAFDLWGASWTAEDINANNFGVALSVDPNNRTASVDYMQIAVTYTVPDVDPYVPVAGNLIQNPSFEEGSGDSASSWVNNAFGSNTSAFSIVAGHSGNRAGQINTTFYTDGDAKWVHQAVSVSEGEYYKFAFWYKSTAPAELDSLYNGSAWNNIASLPLASNWTKYETDLLIPAGVSSLQFISLAIGVGTLTTDDYSLVKGTAPVFGTGGMVSLTFDDGYKNIYNNAIPILNAASFKSTQYISYTTAILNGNGGSDTMTKEELLALQTAGHDIGSHTRNHAHLTISGADLTGEIGGSKTDLSSMGFTPVDSFAYPFGEYNDTVINAVKTAGYQGARTVEQGYNFTNTDPYQLRTFEIDGDTTVDQVKTWINTARTQKAWLILLFHEVKDGDCANAPETYCVNKSNFQSIVTYLKAQNMTVPTVSEGLAVMFGASVPDTILPVLTEKTAVPTLTKDNTPDYTFNSTEAGTITYAGDCASATTTAVAGDNTITFDTPVLTDGAHTNCTITVKDAANNTSAALAVFPFTVDATLPVVNITSAIDGAAVSLPLDGNGHTKSNSISVAFEGTDLNGVASLECALDAGTYAACTSPVANSNLLDGSHTVSVKATDTAGNLNTVGFTWVVDNTKPEITVAGVNPVTTAYGSGYTDAGATALDNVDGDLTGSIVTVNPVNNTSVPGVYTITYDVKDATGNIADQKFRTVTVVSADQAITFDPISDKTYGDASFALNATAFSGFPVTFTAGLFDPVTILGNMVTINGVGPVTITASQAGDGNYNAASDVSQTFTINKLAVTVSADAKSKTYGDSDPALTYQITSGSLVGSDAFAGTLTRSAGEDVGTYAINQNDLALNNNYTLTYVGANLTIGTIEINVSAVAKSKIYGDSDPVLTYTFTPALIGSDTFSGGLVREVGENVGTYAINQGTLALPGNYAITYTGSNLTINQRDLKVVADNQDKVMGDSDPVLTYKITGGLLQFSDTFSLSRAEGETPGTYAIDLGSMDFIINYALDYIAGIFTIYEFPPVIAEETTSALTENSITISWTTDHPATSRVVYDTVSHPTLDAAPNYGYANSTVEADNSPKVLSHSVSLTGLNEGTTYYYRSVSHGSPETVSEERSFKTESSDDDDDDDDDDDNKKSKKKSPSVAAALAYVGGNSAFATESEGTVSGAESEKEFQLDDQNDQGSVLGDENPTEENMAGVSNQRSNLTILWPWILLVLVVLGTGWYFAKRKRA